MECLALLTISKWYKRKRGLCELQYDFTKSMWVCVKRSHRKKEICYGL